MDKIKVLVVDDSAFMRKIISDMLSKDSSIEVVDTAMDGVWAIEKLKSLKVDVVTMDVEMPRMNGLDALKTIRDAYGTPVIMLSGFTSEGADITIKALELGAFDFVLKPAGADFNSDILMKELVDKIKLCCQKKRAKSLNIKRDIAELSGERLGSGEIKGVCIAASTGGPKALSKVIPMFPRGYKLPVLVVQHMPAGFTKAFADRLNSTSELRVKEAEDGDSIEAGTVYIAPGGFHMVVDGKGKLSLNQEPPLHGVRPCADKLFISAARNMGGRLVGVVLTGMGRDGTDGLAAIKEKGGICIAEDESTCTIFGMPKSAIEKKVVHKIVPLHQIVKEIINITGE